MAALIINIQFSFFHLDRVWEKFYDSLKQKIPAGGSQEPPSQEKKKAIEQMVKLTSNTQDYTENPAQSMMPTCVYYLTSILVIATLSMFN